MEEVETRDNGKNIIKRNIRLFIICFLIISCSIFIICKMRTNNIEVFMKAIEINNIENYTKEELFDKKAILNRISKINEMTVGQVLSGWIFFSTDERNEISDTANRIIKEIENMIKNHYSTKKERITLEKTNVLYIENKNYHVFKSNTKEKISLSVSNTALYRDTENPYIIIEYNIYQNKNTGEYEEYKDSYTFYCVELHIQEGMDILSLDDKYSD